MKTAQLPVACSHEWSYHQNCSRKYCSYHQSNQSNHNDQRSNYHHQDNRCHDCPQCNDKDMRSNKSYDKKDDCKRNHFKKRSDKAMHNDQTSSASTLSKRRSRSCSRSPSCSCFYSWSCSCSSSRSYSNHHVDQENHKPSAAPKQGYFTQARVCVWTWPPVGVGCLNYTVSTARLTHPPTTPATSYPLGLCTSVSPGGNVSWRVSLGNVDRTETVNS